jgi:hypothetical protein
MKRKTDEEVVGIVNLVRMCQQLRALPQAGGIYDQDSYFVFLYQQVVDADNERQRLDQAKQRTR